MIVDITISSRSFVFSQSDIQISAGLTNISDLAVSMSLQTVLLRTTLTRTITIYRIMIWLLGSNHLQFYIPLDGRANDLLRTTSVMQKLWFNHSSKDLGLVPAGLRLKSPLNTQEAIQIVKATCRRLVRARINDCHRRLELLRRQNTTTT